jgi:hypothetical protein
MADSKVLSLAKEMLTYDSKSLDDIFSACEQPALLTLSRFLPIDLLSIYVSEPVLTYSKVELGSESYLIRVYVDRIDAYKIGNIITIDQDELSTKIYNGKYIIQNLNIDDKWIEVRNTFSVTETGIITNISHEKMLYAHAYLILSKLAIHSQSIVSKDVIYSSQQFGNGNMAPASQSEKKFLSDRYFQQAMSYIGTVNSMVI